MKLLRLWQKDLKHVIASPALFMGFLVALFFIVFDPERHLWRALGIKGWVAPVFGIVVLCGRHTLKHPFQANLMPFLLMLMWSAGMGFYALSIEWKTYTVYFEKTLAVRGITLMTSKTLSILTGVFFLTCLGFGCLALEYGNRMIWLWSSVSSAAFAIIAFFMFILCFSSLLIELGEFAYIVGRGFYRYRSIWMAFTFVVALYLLFALILCLTPLFSWVPEVHYVVDAKTYAVHSAYFFPGLLSNILLLTVNGWLFEHWAKV